jgi:hypothetical protein
MYFIGHRGPLELPPSFINVSRVASTVGFESTINSQSGVNLSSERQNNLQCQKFVSLFYFTRCVISDFLIKVTIFQKRK